LSPEQNDELGRKLKPAIYNYLASQDSASFWIDHRDSQSDEIYMIIRTFQGRIEKEEKLKEVTEKKNIEKKLAQEARTEATLHPLNQKSGIAIEINIEDSILKIKTSGYDQNVRETLYKRGFRFNDSDYIRKINKFSGPIEDRAVEMACMFLENGYSVTIFNEELREKVKNNDWLPEKTRWIVRIADTDYFRLLWGRNENYYDQAKSAISGANWDKETKTLRVQAINISDLDEVVNFAEKYDFEFSSGAFQLEVEKREQIEKNIVIPKKPENTEDTPF
jgi:hypothetical protein